MKNEINPTAGSSNSDEDIFRYLFYNALNPTAGSSNQGQRHGLLQDN